MKRLNSRWHFLVIALGFVIGCPINIFSPSAIAKPNPSKLAPHAISVKSFQIRNFDKFASTKTQFGKLRWIGGLQLTSPSENFGGWSGLAMERDGKSFIAVSDAGVWMTAGLSYKSGLPDKVFSARIGPFQALNGKNLKRGRDRDAEAVIFAKGSLKRGRLLIAFEQNHRVGRFDIGKKGLSRPRSYIRPAKAGRRMRSLKGFEAISILPGGRYRGSLVAFAERLHDGRKNHTAWLWVKGKPKVFHVKDVGGYDITDAGVLSNGDLVILERRFRWLEGVRMRIRRIALRRLKPGVLIIGEILIHADMSQHIDNMEALGVHRDERGDVLTLMSDDNFKKGLQRTLLLQFHLPDPPVKAKKKKKKPARQHRD